MDRVSMFHSCQSLPMSEVLCQVMDENPPFAANCFRRSMVHFSITHLLPFFIYSEYTHTHTDTHMPAITALPYLFWKIIKINRALGKYGEPFKSYGFCHS